MNCHARKGKQPHMIALLLSFLAITTTFLRCLP